MAEIIVTGSRALAGKYRRYLAEHPGKQETTIWTWPDLLREVGAAVGAAPARLLSPLHHSLLVREACLACRSQLRQFGEIAATRGFWAGMGRFVTQIRQSGAELESVVSELNTARDVSVIVERYLQLLAASGLTDIGGRYRQLAATVREADIGRRAGLAGITGIHLVGLTAPTGVQAELLNALELHGIGSRHSDSLIPPTRPGKITLLSAAEPYGEVREIADQVVSLLSAGASLAEVTVIYPQEQYLALLRKEFLQRGVPLRASSKQALKAIPLIQRLLTGFAMQRGAATTAAGYLERFTQFVAEAAVNPLWLSELSDGGKEDSRRLAAREMRAVESLLELAAEAGEALQVVYGDQSLSSREYCEVLGMLAGQADLWQEPYPGPGLRCVPLTEAASVLGRHLFFGGLSQQVLGHKRPGWLPEIGPRSEPTAPIELLLAEGPETAVLSFSQADTAGHLNLRPLYFHSIQERWQPKEVVVPYYRPGPESVHQNADDIGVRTKLAVESARRSVQVTQWDGDLSSVAGHIYQTPESRCFGVSRLEAYLNCPFSFFAQTLLRLEVTDEELGEVQAVDEGSLIHAVLRDFYEAVDLPLVPRKFQEYLAVLEKLLEQGINRQRIENPAVLPGAWEVSRLRLSGFLAGVLRAELEAEDDFRPSKLEEAILPLTLDTALGEISLRGRIDRIDSDGAGGWRLIDYKGGVVKLKDIKEYNRLQLALYAEAWQRRLAEAGEAVDSLGVCYYSYRKGQRTLYEPTDLQETADWLAGAVTVATGAAEAILAGDFLPQPLNADVCKWCGFGDLCRASDGLEHKIRVGRGGATNG